MAIQRAYKKRKLPTPKQIEQIAKGWHPYCSYAAWYLWRSLESPAAKASNHKGHKGTRKKATPKSQAKREIAIGTKE
jgi:hypothetical protein